MVVVHADKERSVTIFLSLNSICSTSRTLVPMLCLKMQQIYIICRSCIRARTVAACTAVNVKRRKILRHVE